MSQPTNELPPSPRPQDYKELTGQEPHVLSHKDYDLALGSYLPQSEKDRNMVPPDVTKAAQIALAEQGIFWKDNWNQ